MTMRWGIIGPGRIAAAVADDLASKDAHVIGAVGSRDRSRAEEFARVHAPGATAYGSYDELLADPSLDAVYAATPHSQHAAHALAAISAGKPVLVEKAFTATYASAERVVAAAREAGVFAMEAMWTRFLPPITAMAGLIADGAIGEVRAVQADLGTRREVVASDRTFSLALGGGTLLDLGVYTVSFAQSVLGEPLGVTAVGSLLSTGVDGESALLVDFGDGRSAVMQTSFRAPSPGFARVFGTDGWIDVPPRFHHPDRIVLHRHGHEPEEIFARSDGPGYSYEFDEVARCLAAGATESPVMPLADTLAVMRVLSAAAEQLGVALVDEL